MAWFGLPSAETRAPAGQVRWLVVDCETSGLDPFRDRLLSIGAVAVVNQRLAASDVFEAFLRQERPSDPANILVHGIGEQMQREGVAPLEAMQAFGAFAGAAPLAAFHADFDRAVLERAARQCGVRLKSRWLDLARLLPALFPAMPRSERTLDDWLARFAIAHPGRHDALADAYVSAQLLQIGLAEGARQGFVSVNEILSASRSAKWLGA